MTRPSRCSGSARENREQGQIGFRAVILALPWVLLGCTVLAADDHPPSKPLDIRVQAGAFGQAGTADIAAVLQSAGGELWRNCPGIQLDGIDVYRRTDHPQINFKRTPGGRIAIGLATQDAFWAQYSFQFAHEFCHALANYGDHRRSVPYPRQANLWLEESLCETASLFTLRAMSRSWQTAPPYPIWKDYAPYFSSYVDARLALPKYHLPAGTPFSVWFRDNQAALRLDPTMRDRNTIIATQCLPLFEAEPGAWKTMAFLNRELADPNESLAQHFARWQFHCPEELRPFIRKLALVFAVRL